MSEDSNSFVDLCGELRAQLDGRPIEAALPGRQGRLLFAYLVCNRERPVRREELLELLWPQRLPPDPDAGLRTRLSKLRRALGTASLEGRSTLTLRLPPQTAIDLEEAVAALDRAERALGASDAETAAAASAEAARIAGRGFCGGLDGAWVEQRRAEVEELRLRALECRAEAALRLAGPELDTAIDAAREVIASDPVRESAHRLLMTALARRDRIPEALKVYDELRRSLREELGTVPVPGLTQLHDRLLRGGLAPGASGAWVVVNPQTSREWVIEFDDLLLVGRDCARVDPTRRLVLDDPTVSREHLELRRDEAGVVLVDLSTNGTRVNGRPVEPGQPTPLGDRDLIELGDERLLFRTPERAEDGGEAARTTLRRG